MTVLVNPKALTDQAPRDFKMLIDGKWLEASGTPIDRIAPSHGVVVSRFQAGTKADAERAIAVARNAFDNGPGLA